MLRLVVREGMIVGAIGIVAGLVAALALSRVLRASLFDVPARDPRHSPPSRSCSAVVALAACTVPARRAARVDPMVALRDE